MRRRCRLSLGERGGQLIEYGLVLAFVVVLVILFYNHRWKQGFSFGTAFEVLVDTLEGIVYSLADIVGIRLKPFRVP